MSQVANPGEGLSVLNTRSATSEVAGDQRTMVGLLTHQSSPPSVEWRRTGLPSSHRTPGPITPGSRAATASGIAVSEAAASFSDQAAASVVSGGESG
ncbi:hypothetical protein GCM10022235_83690 [Kribbella ginsengisoli]|uniref:Uncharacterized protein n=1 Tax=Kribbella ginsengisoli TaxID=363865 RepID=A0ABP6Z622_9ACTN